MVNNTKGQRPISSMAEKNWDIRHRPDQRMEDVPILERHFKELNKREQKPYLDMEKRFKGMSVNAQRNYARLWKSKIDRRQLTDPLVPRKKVRSSKW